MHGANFEGPRRRGRFNKHRAEVRNEFPDFVVSMSSGRPSDRDPEFDGPRGPRGFGGHGPGPHHRGRRGGRRARRGDIRLAILLLLDEEPRNGYGLMQEVEERSGGVWRPSPGSVYPALSQLEDEGLVEPTEEQGRKAFRLTDEGSAHVEENREKMGTPWKTVGEGASSELHELRNATQGLAMAAKQVAQSGDAAQITSAKAIVDEARRGIYRLLAGDEPTEKDSD